MTGVPITKLRQWGERFSRLRPKRNRVGHRYYDADEVQAAKIQGDGVLPGVHRSAQVG